MKGAVKPIKPASARLVIGRNRDGSMLFDAHALEGRLPTDWDRWVKAYERDKGCTVAAVWVSAKRMWSANEDGQGKF